ncbi:DUF2431 domain-containing protein [Scytonema sp. UIC 10036]|uniref:Rossmann-like fold-containing protein n=1 Tax=Scytonema sp. UIC 10036 TaxID=2304196 RepID=UPI0012DABE6C|nr:Rossmann-like fold-containing protein [Scytonema sp. UIC 10036]MUG97769.1 DUF2431 domain-containing protein [Scytonema sp. UIC 10036]
MRVLVVGDNTFEYSRTLRDKPGMEGTHITATGIESKEEVEDLLKNVNDSKLKKFPSSQENFEVRHGVNATRLQENFPNLREENKFDKIIFNNPQAGKKGVDDVDLKTGNLIDGVLTSSPQVLQQGGEVHFGVTSSTRALGLLKLQDHYQTSQEQGFTEIAGRKFEVRLVDTKRDEYEFSVKYPARRTEGTKLRNSQGPSYYYIFKLLA